MSNPFEQILQTFIQEAKEQLHAMESSLLLLESEPNDSETIDALFRSAHTIKGSAGLFGLTAMVSFTHILEDVLDRLRNNEVSVDTKLIALLLECGDHLQELLRVTVINNGEMDDRLQQREVDLRERLQNYQNRQQPLDVVNTPREDRVAVTGNDLVVSNLWHISLRFGSDVFRHGMEPLSFLRYLATLGKIVNITTLIDAMPDITTMDAESCYLGFEIDFDSDIEKHVIEDVFAFVREDCIIKILPPRSKISEYIELIRNLPEDESRLGEILVASGALTAQELQHGLAQQQAGTPPSGTLLGEILVEQNVVEPALVQAALDKQSLIKEKKIKENLYIRVQAEKLDHLINLVGELVIASAGARLLTQQSQDAAAFEAASQVTDLVEEIRDGALRLRMVPVGETFGRFQRVVRDVSQELGKDIELRINGGETEVDKTVAEKISDPLMHLLRNSMDHGIESTERRIAMGKSAKGSLTLNAYHDSGSIVIEVADDGAGLNQERILQKAVDRGLVVAGATPSDQEIYNLIFEPGFSTADAVTSLSGRGVGMDVVKRNISELRGTIELTSQAHQGTRVRIRLPLTLAIIDGFLVGVGQASYVVPLDLVQECIELAENERTHAHARNHLNLRGEVLPLIFLRSHFRLEESRSRRENVVVVRCAGQKVGLVVDELQGELQAVIKPLGKLFSGLRGISGSTILGSGDVALILDVPALMLRTVTNENSNNRKAGVYRLPLTSEHPGKIRQG